MWHEKQQLQDRIQNGWGCSDQLKVCDFFCRVTGKIICRQDFEKGTEVLKIGSQKCTIEGDTKMVLFVRNKSKTKVKSRHDDNFTE